MNGLFRYGWVWPQSIKDTPTGTGRLGRVLHWIASGISVAIFAAAIWNAGLGLFTVGKAALSPFAHPFTSFGSIPGEARYDGQESRWTYVVRLPSGRIGVVEGDANRTESDARSVILEKFPDQAKPAIRPLSIGQRTNVAMRLSELRISSSWPKANSHFFDGLACLIAALCTFMTGRALRYILSAE